jgi:hypothetical protein
MSFDAGRVRIAGWIVAAGGVALFVFLFFFDWFGGGVSGLPIDSHITGTRVSATGWQTFTSSRWIWLATIIVALGSTLATALDYRFDAPLRPAAIAAGLGALSSGLIIYRIAHHPSASVSIGHLRASYGIKLGIWLGLLAALAIAIGGYLQAQEEAKPPVEKPSKPPKPAPKRSEAFSGLTVTPAQPPAGARRSEDVPKGEPSEDALEDTPAEAAPEDAP